jgi:hypothetical protein
VALRKIRVLIVEDRETQHLVPAMLNKHSCKCSVKEKRSNDHVVLSVESSAASVAEVHIKRFDGVDDIIARFTTESKASDLESIAVVVDADDDVGSRWSKLSSLLSRMGCGGVPKEISREGVVSHIPDGPKVGIWIMPDNRSTGMVEDFAIRLIPANDPVLPLVDKFLEGIPDAIRPFSLKHKAKARIYTWLAVRKVPGRPLGQAISNKDLDYGSPDGAAFVKWMILMMVG